MECFVAALEDNVGLIAAYVTQELAPGVGSDIHREGIGEVNGVQKGEKSAEMGVIHTFRNAQSQFSDGRNRDPVSFLFGAHFLCGTPDHLFRREDVSQNLFAGNAVENGDQCSVLPNQVSAGFDAVLQTAEFAGKEQKVNGGMDLGCIGIVEVSQFSVIVKSVFTVTVDPFAVCQNQNVFLSQRIGKELCVKGTQSAETDDANGLDTFHAIYLLL
jgi:hypothetical protein